MNREWVPGDVAAVTWDGRTVVRLLSSRGSGAVWWGPSGYIAADDAAAVRPLVVIDPEDRAQVERLVCLIDSHADPVDALREFANPTPPKLDEPTGWLAAVEEPGNERRWYRDGDHDSDHPWRQLRDDGVHARNTWAELPHTVRKLSDGITS